MVLAVVQLLSALLISPEHDTCDAVRPDQPRSASQRLAVEALEAYGRRFDRPRDELVRTAGAPLAISADTTDLVSLMGRDSIIVLRYAAFQMQYIILEDLGEYSMEATLFAPRPDAPTWLRVGVTSATEIRARLGPPRDSVVREDTTTYCYRGRPTGDPNGEIDAFTITVVNRIVTSVRWVFKWGD